MSDSRLQDLPDILPIFPLSGVLLLPRGHLPLHIFEPRYRAMTEAALRADRLIGMIQPRTPQNDPVDVPAPVYPIGCAGKIVSFAESDDGRYLITLRGVCRFDIAAELPLQEGFRRIRPDFRPYSHDREANGSGGFDRGRLLSLVRPFLEAKSLNVDWQAIDEASDEALVTALAMSCPFEPSEKQALLEAVDTRARAEMLMSILEIALRDADSPNPPMLQ